MSDELAKSTAILIICQFRKNNASEVWTALDEVTELCREEDDLDSVQQLLVDVVTFTLQHVITPDDQATN